MIDKYEGDACIGKIWCQNIREAPKKVERTVKSFVRPINGDQKRDNYYDSDYKRSDLLDTIV